MVNPRTSDEEPSLSVIIPAYDEEQSLPILTEQFLQTFKENHLKGEIIIINDGSNDGTGKIGEELSRKDKHVRIYHHKRRMGKTAALLTGFEHASGGVIAFIDADLQYAPEDLPKLLDLINNGYDAVNGWRKHRKDSILRKFPSSLYNFLSRVTFGLALHDHNSGFKVIKREVLMDINPRKEQHRFLLNLAYYKGYKIGEVEIQHFPRKYGKTKYRSDRIILGLLDLVALRLQLTFIERPMVLFGLTGLSLLILGSIFGIDVVLLNFLYNEPFSYHLARLLLAALLVIAGIQVFLFGFIADMISNVWAEQNRYLTKEHLKEKNKD